MFDLSLSTFSDSSDRSISPNRDPWSISSGSTIRSIECFYRVHRAGGEDGASLVGFEPQIDQPQRLNRKLLDFQRIDLNKMNGYLAYLEDRFPYNSCCVQVNFE